MHNFNITNFQVKVNGNGVWRRGVVAIAPQIDG
jgi:hypothetical protein